MVRSNQGINSHPVKGAFDLLEQFLNNMSNFPNSPKIRPVVGNEMGIVRKLLDRQKPGSMLLKPANLNQNPMHVKYGMHSEGVTAPSYGSNAKAQPPSLPPPSIKKAET